MRALYLWGQHGMMEKSEGMRSGERWDPRGGGGGGGERWWKEKNIGGNE